MRVFDGESTLPPTSHAPRDGSALARWSNRVLRPSVHHLTPFLTSSVLELSRVTGQLVRNGYQWPAGPGDGDRGPGRPTNRRERQRSLCGLGAFQALFSLLEPAALLSPLTRGSVPPWPLSPASGNDSQEYRPFSTSMHVGCRQFHCMPKFVVSGSRVPSAARIASISSYTS